MTTTDSQHSTKPVQDALGATIPHTVCRTCGALHSLPCPECLNPAPGHVATCRRGARAAAWHRAKGLATDRYCDLMRQGFMQGR